MELLVTLVAPADQIASDLIAPERVASLVESLGAHHAERLDERAVELRLMGELVGTGKAVGELLADAPVDAIVQPLEGRRKRLLISDMDSTLIGQECIDELAAVRGLKAEVAAITERAMHGEVDFEEALIERVRLLKGVPLATIDALLADAITLSPGAEALIERCRAHGVRTVLVSGGFTAFAEPIGQRLGMDAAYANTLVAVDGVLTGEVERPILAAEHKRARLLDECARLGIDASAAVALGDGANDIPMLRAAGLGIAYRAKPLAIEAADAAIRHADLTAVIYALGLNSRSEPKEAVT